MAWAAPGGAGEPNDERERIGRVAAGWSDTSQIERVRRLARRYDVHVEFSPHWRSLELRAFERGLAALPEAFFEHLRRPVSVERRPRACPLGQGAYREPCPAFDVDRRTFYLYDSKTETSGRLGPGAGELDEKLRERLMYRRAAVHLVVARLDERYDWSRSRTWRQINGWYRDEPRNEAERGYSRPLGRRSAHLDLVTFAEEFFARPEQLFAAAGESGSDGPPAGFDPDDSIVCRMFTRSRFLRRVTREVAGRWEPPGRVNASELDGAWNAAGTGCPDFEQWLDFEHFEGLELLYAAASSDQPESLFGHLLVHARYTNEASVFRAGAQPVFQFGAITDTGVGPLGYVFGGMFGGFSSVLEFNTLRAIRRLYLRYEERELRRYRLRLTREEQLRVMQRIWEAERHVRYRYHFFRHNCASFLLDLLRPVLEGELGRQPGPIVLPAHVLDALAATDNAEGRPVLESGYGGWSSSTGRARRAVERRRRRLEQLRALARVGAAAGARLEQLHADLESPDASRRRRTYRQLGEWVEEFVARGDEAREVREPEVMRLLVDYLYLGTVVERYAVERARFERLEAALEVIGVSERTTAEEKLEMRREIYGIDSLEERLAAWNDRMKSQLLRLADREQTVDAPEVRRLRRRERRLHETYLASLDALSQAVSAGDGEWSGTQYARRRREARDERLRERQRGAIASSGAARASIGSAVAVSRGSGRGGGWRGGGGYLDVSVAFLDSALGEMRSRGIRPEVEARAGDLQLRLPAGPSWFRRMQADLTLFRYFETTGRSGPLADGLLDRLGWGVDFGAHHDGERGVGVGTRLSGGLLVPFASGGSRANHLVGGLFAAGRADLGRTRSGTMLGGRALLRGQLRASGERPSFLRLDLQSRHYVRLEDASWQYDLTGELAWRQALRAGPTRPLWLVPWLEVDHTTVQYLPGADALEAGGGLRLEFSL